ncbi:MAG: enoyl-CoA hydratase [Saprospiraceae bacterium]|nr:enoyl-CoA hydratase [Saprospiraceae bacterium]
MQDSYPSLVIAQNESVLTVSIDRPETLNAINGEVMHSLHDLFSDLRKNKNLRGVILTGAGDKAFAAGADIKEFSFEGDRTREISAFGHETFNLIETCPLPVIAAVNGFALGGGCELAMACHLRIASKTAVFGQPEIKLGLIPGYGGTQRLPRLIGRSRALEMLLTGKTIEATQALKWGLVNMVVEPTELMQASSNMLQKISAPLAATKIISLVDAHFKADDAFEREIQAFHESFKSEDAREGVDAFLAKRKAIFKGK